ncbi:MAG: hypothetical protein KDD70_02690, partial [Bdellovibrionales bacterium]|nr:hypothetical protein [Bdellovibrionales bacterium]
MKHLLLSEGILVLFVLSSVTLAAPPGRDPNSCEGCPVPYAACDIPHEACSPWDGKAASKEAARQQAESNLKSYLRQQCDDRFLVPKGV